MIETLLAQLTPYFGDKLRVKVQENRVQLLSFESKGCVETLLKIHRAFLKAPQSVIAAIGRYFTRGDRKSYRTIQEYIYSEPTAFTRSRRRMDAKLSTRGSVYDLKELYDEVNAEYFQNELELKIGWYGNGSRRVARRITFGTYADDLKLIRMHRRLDNEWYPRYFVAYIVYHEMLHAVIPPYCDKRGRVIRHGPEFKSKERQFRQWSLAQSWLKTNRKALFTNGYEHGRS